MRPSDMSLGGLWSLVPAGTMEPTERAVALVESLLDRFGVIASPLVELAAVEGGFSTIYPVLRRMEESGSVIRGMFVEGYGAAQFARKDVVDRLRHLAEDSERHQSGQAAGRVDSRGDSIVAVDVLDPSSLVGAAMPWPKKAAGDGGASRHRVTRRQGAVTVLRQGSPLLYALPASHRLVLFHQAGKWHGANQSDSVPDKRFRNAGFDLSDGYETDDLTVIRRAMTELAYYLRRQYQSTVFFAEINGQPLTMRGPLQSTMRAAGFVPSPQGMKLYP